VFIHSADKAQKCSFIGPPCGCVLVGRWSADKPGGELWGESWKTDSSQVSSAVRLPLCADRRRHRVSGGTRHGNMVTSIITPMPYALDEQRGNPRSGKTWYNDVLYKLWPCLDQQRHGSLLTFWRFTNRIIIIIIIIRRADVRAEADRCDKVHWLALNKCQSGLSQTVDNA